MFISLTAETRVLQNHSQNSNRRQLVTVIDGYFLQGALVLLNIAVDFLLRPIYNGAMLSSEQFATEIIRRLRDNQYDGFFVGGCVRDRLLGLIPKDYDVCTNATPDQLQQLFPGSDLVGAHFGVIIATRCGPHSGPPTEIATFRSDGIYSDGRRPDTVQYEAYPANDVLRRDFTINALLEDPLAGNILDLVDGRADLTDHIIRAIGNPGDRFREDYLRMLRAVRFAARFQFLIDGDTKDAIHSAASRITQISAERIQSELNHILTEGDAGYGFRTLSELGLLSYILPEVYKLRGVAQPLQFHPEGDVFTHTMLMLDQLQTGCSLPLALSVLLHDIGKPATQTVDSDGRIRFNGHAEHGAHMARTILERLKYSNDIIERTVNMVLVHMQFMNTSDMKKSTLKRFIRIPNFPEYLELHRIDCVGGGGNLEHYDFVSRKLAELGTPEILRPVPLVNGRDLLAAGYQPGPLFRQALELAETAQLDGVITTRDEALQLALTVFA